MSQPVKVQSPSQPDREIVRSISRTDGRADTIRVLLVESDRSLRDGCAAFFQTGGCVVTSTGDDVEALQSVQGATFDLVLVDLDSSPERMELVRTVRDIQRDALVVVMTAQASVASSVEAVTAGAWNYLLKPFTPDHLEVLLGRATHVILSRRTGGGQRKGAAPARATPSGEPFPCIGQATSFLQAIELAQRVAMSDASVMVFGESGTGKEVVANLIHRRSHRRLKPLVPLNCAALPDALLESEMFGHRKGSFTGAERDKPGLLEMAHAGTFFLDELTEMTPRLQAKLLRVIQDGVVRRVGSEQQDARVDIRFISATNVQPHEAVAAGTLRKDLFYRLRVVLIKLPALRERVEDIPLLAEHFLTQYWARYRGTQQALPRFAASTMSLLKSRPWTGNVRELQNVIEHVSVLAQPGGVIAPDDIPQYDEPVETSSDTFSVPQPLLERDYYPARDQIVAEFDRVYLSRLVGRAGGNMSKAARIASIDRTTLYRLVERYGLNGRDESGVAEAASA